MARPRCLSLFACTSMLLLLISCSFFHDTEAFECPSVVHKRVGDTVEFSSCLPPEGVTNALWTYKDEIVAELDEDRKGFERYQFKGRTSLNCANFSLTVRRLTLQDSGVYRFYSEVNNVTITLHVHAYLTPPVLTVASTWNTSSESCTVLLDCNSPSGSEVTYNWTVKNQTLNGSRLQFTIWPREAETTFTCTIFNFISEQSALITVKCNGNANMTEDSSPSLLLLPLMSGLIIGSLLIILLLLPLVFCSQSKGGYRNRMNQSQSVNQDETQQHVYCSLLHGDGSVYEMLRVSENAGNVLRVE